MTEPSSKLIDRIMVWLKSWRYRLLLETVGRVDQWKRDREKIRRFQNFCRLNNLQPKKHNRS